MNSDPWKDIKPCKYKDIADGTRLVPDGLVAARTGLVAARTGLVPKGIGLPHRLSTPGIGIATVVTAGARTQPWRHITTEI